MNNTPLFVVIVCAVFVSCGIGRAETINGPHSVLLFDSGTDGYPRYRIPALIVMPKGTLLAFCEGRKDGGGLTGNIDLIIKRSLDSGKSWQALQVVADDGPNTLGNPCPVIDRSTGTIWLPYTRSLGTDTEQQIVAGTSQERTRVMLTHSRDDGATWAEPLDITAAVKRPEWTWYGTGPGVGIQLQSGRLLVPSYHVVAGTENYRSHMIFSDDHGRTWQMGGVVGDNTSECQVAQRRDGTIYLSARTVRGTELRTIATSRDDGKSWSPPVFDKQLYDPHCQACVYVLPSDNAAANPHWLAAHPAGPGRRDLTIRLSLDEGRSWPVAKLLHRGDSQYSCLALLPDGEIGCLYESWHDGNYRIYFAKFSPNWLTEGIKR